MVSQCVEYYDDDDNVNDDSDPKEEEKEQKQQQQQQQQQDEGDSNHNAHLQSDENSNNNNNNKIQKKKKKRNKKPPTVVCDEVVVKVFKTFWSFDDTHARKHLKEANATVMERLVEIQRLRGEMLRQVEFHPNGQTASKVFSRLARNATNSEGRVQRLLLARVPLIEFDILDDGKCRITATSILCSQTSFFGKDPYHLFDVKAVDCVLVNHHVMHIQSRSAPHTVLYKLQTAATNLIQLTYFLKALQSVQTVFEPVLIQGNGIWTVNEGVGRGVDGKQRAPASSLPSSPAIPTK
jgi:hypothetical protein